MIGLTTLASDRPLRVLCLGAHCDDIEIGCGATIRRLVRRERGAEVAWHVFSSSERRVAGARESASRFLDGAMSSHVDIRSFRNGYFPYVAADIKDYFESLKDGLDPDIVLTHFREDRHQDHRTISDLTWNTFRNHMILEYEIPKFDGDLCTPNFYVPVNEEDADFKVTAIMDCFATQAPKEWFDERTFFALMRPRGVECIAQSGLAEAFYVRKAVFDSK